MIEMMDHLRLVERHMDAPVLMPPIRTVPAKPLFGKLGGGAEVAAVGGHVEQPLKRDPPRIPIAIRLILSLPDQNRRCPIQLSRQVQIGPGAEQWRRQRVGINKLKVVYAEKDSTLFFVDIVYSLNVEYNWDGTLVVCHYEYAEWFSLVRIFEPFSHFIETVQCSQLVPRHQIGEEGAGRAVRRDPCWHNDTRPPRWRRAYTASIGDDLRDAPLRFPFLWSPRQPGKELGKQRVGVHVARTGQREAPGLAHEYVPGLGRTLGGFELFRQPRLRCSRVGHLERLDQLVTLGLIGRGRDLAVANGKELLFLQLDPLPRRVAYHCIEAAPRHDGRELQGPVEDAVCRGRLDAVSLHVSSDVAAADGVPDRIGRRLRKTAGVAGIGSISDLGQQEGRHIHVAGGIQCPPIRAVEKTVPGAGLGLGAFPISRSSV